MKKIFFHITLFVYCSLSAMHPIYDEYAQCVIKKSRLIINAVIHNCPPQPWQFPHDRAIVVTQCQNIEKYFQTLPLTHSYQFNKTIISIMGSIIDLISQIYEAMHITGNEASIHQIDMIKQNMRALRFSYSSTLHRQEMCNNTNTNHANL